MLEPRTENWPARDEAASRQVTSFQITINRILVSWQLFYQSYRFRGQARVIVVKKRRKQHYFSTVPLIHTRCHGIIYELKVSSSACHHEKSFICLKRDRVSSEAPERTRK